MDPVWVTVAVLVVAGAVVAVSSSVPWRIVAGLGVALIGSPLIGGPGSTLPLLSRLVGAALATYLVWIGLRGAPATRGSLLGPLAEALIAAGAFAAGWLLAGSLASLAVEPTAGEGPSLVLRAAAGAGAALAVAAATPVLLARDVARLGVGLLLLIAAIDPARRVAGLDAADLAEVGVACTTVATGAAVAWLCGRARASGAFAMPPDPRRAAR